MLLKISVIFLIIATKIQESWEFLDQFCKSVKSMELALFDRAKPN